MTQDINSIFALLDWYRDNPKYLDALQSEGNIRKITVAGDLIKEILRWLDLGNSPEAADFLECLLLSYAGEQGFGMHDPDYLKPLYQGTL